MWKTRLCAPGEVQPGSMFRSRSKHLYYAEAADYFNQGSIDELWVKLRMCTRGPDLRPNGALQSRCVYRDGLWLMEPVYWTEPSYRQRRKTMKREPPKSGLDRILEFITAPEKQRR